MSGEKMVQARNAATFIVENLNPGDYFNVIDFDDIITSFQPDHVPFTPSSMQQALTYINGLYARGATNISGAFTVAIQDFQNYTDKIVLGAGLKFDQLDIVNVGNDCAIFSNQTNQYVCLIKNAAGQIDASDFIF